MTLKEAYIHLQQGLQTIAAFVYRDIELQELDYFWNQGKDMFIQLAFPDKYVITNLEKYQDIQSSVDDLKVLEVLGATNTLLTTTIGSYPVYYIELPSNYRHLLNDSSVVKPANCATNITREVPNRLSKSEDIKNILESSIYKPTAESPISRLSANRLYVYNTYKSSVQFDVQNIYVDYLKKPAVDTYGVDGATIIEFPDQVCFKIIKTVLIYIAIIAEQNPNKIQFLKQ